jgi:hypothetical protein
MAAQYVLQDRAAATKYAVTINDRRLRWAVTADAAQAEPIMEDDAAPSTYFRWFVSGGRLGIESVLTVQDDAVFLTDPVSGTSYRLIVSGGRQGFRAESDVTVAYIVPTGVAFASASGAVAAMVVAGGTGALAASAAGSAASFNP